MANRQVTVSIDEDVLARVLNRCGEHELGSFLTEAAVRHCEQEERASALDAFTADFGHDWVAPGGWPAPTRTLPSTG